MSAAPADALETSAAARRRLLELAVERVLAHVESLPRQPAADIVGGDAVARAFVEPLPEAGEAPEPLLARLFDEAIPKSFNTAGPGYLAYIPGGGLFESAVAQLVAAAVNRYVGVWLAAPALAQIEATVGRWLCGIVGYPPEALGVLTSGGSLANLTALVTARRERLGDDFLDGTLYVSDQAHHSVHKAALVAGFPAARVREVATDERFEMRLDALRDAIAADRRAGLRPFLVVASAGTTNTGAVDDLAALVELAADEGLWLHVDAAYGGCFMLTECGRRALRGIERADSVTLDPHKGLFLPYGTGALLVRDGPALRRAHSVPAHYMPALQDDPERVDFCEISPELSRGFRGLSLWLPIKLHGIAAFRSALDEKLDLARWAARELRTLPHLELVAEPRLSILAFRLAPPGVAAAERDALNRSWLEGINARQRVYLSGTQLASGFVLRLCVLSFRTHRDRMQQAIEDAGAVAAEVLAAQAT